MLRQSRLINARNARTLSILGGRLSIGNRFWICIRKAFAEYSSIRAELYAENFTKLA